MYYLSTNGYGNILCQCIIFYVMASVSVCEVGSCVLTDWLCFMIKQQLCGPLFLLGYTLRKVGIPACAGQTHNFGISQFHSVQKVQTIKTTAVPGLYDSQPLSTSRLIRVQYTSSTSLYLCTPLHFPSSASTTSLPSRSHSATFTSPIRSRTSTMTTIHPHTLAAKRLDPQLPLLSLVTGPSPLHPICLHLHLHCHTPTQPQRPLPIRQTLQSSLPCPHRSQRTRKVCSTTWSRSCHILSKGLSAPQPSRSRHLDKAILAGKFQLGGH